MPLNPQQAAIIKSTVPILQDHGLAITSTFYSNVLAANPALKNIFSNTHQATGHQARALANSLHAYANNIHDFTPLKPLVELIAHKHVSLHVEPAHYEVVGTFLLAAMKQVLGSALTEEVADAWREAYWQLANLLIEREKQMYDALGQWSDWKTLRIQRKVKETDNITSFYLVPAEERETVALPSWKPGQYISVRVHVEELGFKQPRQYSLSDVPGKGYLRITVKREEAVPNLGDAGKDKATAHPGFVSNILHDRYEEGDLLEATHPVGDFFYDTKENPATTEQQQEDETPLFLISAGVGITPMIAILQSQLDNHLSSPRRPITFLHGAATAPLRPFAKHISRLQQDSPNNLYTIYFNSKATVHAQPQAEAKHDTPQDSPTPTSTTPPLADPNENSSSVSNLVLPGRMDLTKVKETLEQRGLSDSRALFFICGPDAFMESVRTQLVKQYGVDASRVHLELFGTGGKGAVRV